jgi:hypothetical protein
MLAAPVADNKRSRRIVRGPHAFLFSQRRTQRLASQIEAAALIGRIRSPTLRRAPCGPRHSFQKAERSGTRDCDDAGLALSPPPSLRLARHW